MESKNQLQVSNAGQQNGGTNFFKTCFNVLNTLTGPYPSHTHSYFQIIILFTLK
jgi:hypothetical protein